MDFSEFEQALRRCWGDDAALARHEIYFICQRQRGWRQVMHALGGLLRDAWLCARLPGHAAPLAETTCVVSLAGANGWGTLAPLFPALLAAGQRPSTVIHPRLQDKVPGTLPAAPAWADWRLALRALWRSTGPAMPGVSSWTVRCSLARRRLWCGVWRRTLAGAGNNLRLLLLHNDFDLFSANAVAAARETSTIRSACIQHGLPTDEFFPTRADLQLVWGESSRAVFLSHGTPSAAIVTGTWRAKPAMPQAAAPLAPRRILLVSQTHTPVFRRALGDDFQDLAARLDEVLDGELLQILLHPEESRLGHPYSAARLLNRCRNAPHEMLLPHGGPPDEPALVLGFCSTALVEAAQAGHYVLGIDWTGSASQGAQLVGTPPRKARDAEEVLKLFEQLRTDFSLRTEWLQQQARWIGSTFTPLGETWQTDCRQNKNQTTGKK